MNTSVGAMQIAGFGLAGVLLVWLNPYEVFLVAAVLRVVAAAVGWFGLSGAPGPDHRPDDGRAHAPGEPGTVGGSRPPVAPAQPVGAGRPGVGCEALFVPYAGDRAGFLYAAAALGMLAGDVVVGRFLSPGPARPTGPRPAAAARPALPGLRAVAGAAAGHGRRGRRLSGLRGRAAAAGAADRPFPAEIRGQVLGLHTNGMLAAQALCAVLAGTVADLVPASWAVALLATASLAATLVLTAGLRRTAPAPVEAVR